MKQDYFALSRTAKIIVIVFSIILKIELTKLINTKK